MARITPEMVEQINELYAELGVKTQVAKRVGVSVASVNKYLIDDYVPKAQRISIPVFDEDCGFDNFEDFLNDLSQRFCNYVNEAIYEELLKSCELTEEEWKELEELQKGAI